MENHLLFKEESVQGRYVTLGHLTEVWSKKIPSEFFDVLGTSVRGREIFSLTLGEGKKKILLWSQMHGNESTTTKAVLDLVNFLISDDVLAKEIMKNCLLCIVPMLNPDGADTYTRLNANTVDLNRDAKDRSQPETRLLWTLFELFKPDFCFNLHDQRTLFSAGTEKQEAMVSFLSPASDMERKITPSRSMAMRLIVGLNQHLQTYIPKKVGRYDDTFNPNCVGDAFQMEKVPTLLFEAGHYPNDYQRESTRTLIWVALKRALLIISRGSIGHFDESLYFSIPENAKMFYDVLIKNGAVLNPNIALGDSIGIRFEEVLVAGKIQFIPKVEKVGTLTDFFGHIEYDCTKAEDFKSISAQKEIVDCIVTLSKNNDT